MDVNVAKALEKVNVRNLKAVIEYSRATRKVVNKSVEEVTALKNMILQQNLLIEQMRKQITNLQIKTKDIGR